MINLIVFYGKMTGYIDQRKVTDVIVLSHSKAFNTNSYSIIFWKLRKSALNRYSENWPSSCAPRIGINGFIFSWPPLLATYILKLHTQLHQTKWWQQIK